MTGYRLSITARRHLDEILDYSVAHWGERRAEAYLREIQRTLDALADDKLQARPCEHYAPGLSFVRSGSHYIFLQYVAASDLFEVVDVLHQSMDPSRHLTASDEQE